MYFVCVCVHVCVNDTNENSHLLCRQNRELHRQLPDQDNVVATQTVKLQGESIYLKHNKGYITLKISEMLVNYTNFTQDLKTLTKFEKINID